MNYIMTKTRTVTTQSDLVNMTWHEVQRRLLEVQTEQQMCIHKTELTELGTVNMLTISFAKSLFCPGDKNLI